MRLAIESFGSVVDLSGDRRWNSSDLAAEASRRASVLAAAGVGRGSRVVIAHGGSPDFFADLLAVWSRGAMAACLDPGLTAAELSTVIAFTEPAIILSCAATAPGAPPSIPMLDLSSETGSAASSRTSGELDDPALLLFTSGTTGAPKGVVLTFRALLARVALNLAAIGPRPLARSLVTLPTHFGHGLIGNALTPLFAGGDILLPERGLGAARNLGDSIDRHRVTFLSSVPSLWHLALRTSKKPSSGSLQRVHIGSAPLSAALWQSIADWTNSEVINCYGITETANWIAGASSRDGIIDGYGWAALGRASGRAKR